MPQTSVEYPSLRAYYGQLASGNFNIIRGTYNEWVNGEEIVIKFGWGCVADEGKSEGGTAGVPATITPPNPRLIKLPSKAGQRFLGVAVINESYGVPEESMILGKERGFLPGQPIDLLTFGDIFVPTEKNAKIISNEAVSVRHTKTDEHEVGIFSNVADGEHDEIPGARWLRVERQATDKVMGIASINLGRF